MLMPLITGNFSGLSILLGVLLSPEASAAFMRTPHVLKLQRGQDECLLYFTLLASLRWHLHACGES